MTKALIPFEQLTANPFSVFDKQWMLVTSGDFEKQHFNTMTVSMGVSWVDVAQIDCSGGCAPDAVHLRVYGAV